jgi:phytoene dehydrogenase-like protein
MMADGLSQDEQSLVRRAFNQITDGQLKWATMPDVYDRFVIGDRTYEFVSGRERFRARLKEYFPQESTSIDRYIAAVQALKSGHSTILHSKSDPTSNRVPVAVLIEDEGRRRERVQTSEFGLICALPREGE